MSIEEKAKAYDEAIKKLQDIKMYNVPVTPKEIGEYLFPKPKGLDDEKIRKTLIDYFSTLSGDYYGELKLKDIIAWLEKQGEQKPTWSEEDKKKINGICNYLMCSNSPEGYTEWIDWLKSLSLKINIQQKQERSEEEKRMVNATINVLRNVGHDNLAEYWLKSIKSQPNLYDKGYKDGYSAAKYNHWKPSEEQMSMLLAVLNDSNNITAESVHIALKSLYNDLKKL